jgi:hypothetical protein
MEDATASHRIAPLAGRVVALLLGAASVPLLWLAAAIVVLNALFASERPSVIGSTTPEALQAFPVSSWPPPSLVTTTSLRPERRASSASSSSP